MRQTITDISSLKIYLKLNYILLRIHLISFFFKDIKSKELKNVKEKIKKKKFRSTEEESEEQQKTVSEIAVKFRFKRMILIKQVQKKHNTKKIIKILIFVLNIKQILLHIKIYNCISYILFFKETLIFNIFNSLSHPNCL